MKRCFWCGRPLSYDSRRPGTGYYCTSCQAQAEYIRRVRQMREARQYWVELHTPRECARCGRMYTYAQSQATGTDGWYCPTCDDK